MKKLLAIVAILLWVSPAIHAQRNPLPVARTEAGFVSGNVNNGVRVFKGVPFAAPPVGTLRWKAPQPVKPWSDTLACTVFPPSAIQNNPVPFMMWSQEFITPAKPLSEDCLYLNIWTPEKQSKKRLPVLVWIHGGAFISGSGACPVYYGEELAAKDVVVVTINYRLGVFGFMAHPELTKESAANASGNYGLMDQIAALRWVQKNIDAFGGDPLRVTIAGQSAGPFAVQALVASPLAQGLFRGAIAQSGAMTGRKTRTLVEAEQIGVSMAAKAGASTIGALRNVSADSLQAIVGPMSYGNFAPIIDGFVLPGDVREIFRNKQHNDVPIMAGWVEGDADLALREPKTAAAFRSEHTDEFLNVFPAGNEADALKSQRILAALQFAGYPAYQWALSNASNTFIYQFTYRPTNKPGTTDYGAFHTSEVPFAMHNLSQWDRPWTARDFAVEEYMSSYWLNFIKTGNPNGKGLPVWSPFNATNGVIMELGDTPKSREAWYKAEFRILSKENQ